MSDPEMLQLSQLVHVKSPNYINEYVDRVALTGLQSGSITSISMSFGRDTVELTHENIPPGGGLTTIDQDCIKAFRLDVATFTVSMETAKSLAASLVALIEANSEKSTGEA